VPKCDHMGSRGLAFLCKKCHGFIGVIMPWFFPSSLLHAKNTCLQAVRINSYNRFLFEPVILLGDSPLTTTALQKYHLIARKRLRMASGLAKMDFGESMPHLHLSNVIKFLTCSITTIALFLFPIGYIMWYFPPLKYTNHLYRSSILIWAEMILARYVSR